MKIVLTTFFLALSFFAKAEDAVVDWEVKKLEDKFKGQIEQGIKEYLGPDRKINVFVQVNGRKKSEEKVVSGVKDGDYGYLNVDVADYEAVVDDKIIVSSVTTNVFVYEEIDKKIENNIKSIIDSAMKGYKNNVSFKVMPSPTFAKKDDKDANRSPASEADEPFNFSKFFKEHASDFIKLISTIVVGLLGMFGVYLLGKSLMEGFRALGEAMKASTQQFARHQEQMKDKDKEESEKDREDEKKQKIEEVFNNQMEVQFERNMDIIKTCLKSTPHVFKLVMGRSQENLRGLKSLLPMIMELGHILKQIMTEDAWNEMEKIQDLLDEGAFNKWFNKFSEEISIGLMKENGYFSYILDHDLSDKIYMKKFSHIVEGTLAINSPMLYKYILDFLPPDESMNLMNHFDPETWTKILSDRRVDAAGLNGDLGKLLAYCDELEEKDRKEINEKGLARILTAPMTMYLKNRSFDESDEIFNLVAKSAPEFSRVLRSLIWTPSMILLVPESYLSEKFNSLKIDDRVNILYSVPDAVREHLYQFIPQGKVSTIVNDQFNRLCETADDKAIALANKTLKEFLSMLKVESEAGKYALKEDTPNLPSDVYEQDVPTLKEIPRDIVDDGGEGEAAA